MALTTKGQNERGSEQRASGAGVGATSSSPGTAHRWKVLGVGVAANGSLAMALTGIPASAVILRSDYRLEPTDLGLVLGAMGLGLAVSELPWGVLTDRWGDRRVLLTGLGTSGAMLALMALFVSPVASHVPSAGLLGFALLLVGMIGGSLNGSSGRAVMAWFGDGERGLAMSIRQMALPAGGAIGALVLPTLAVNFGFQGVYGALAVLCLLTGGLVWLWVYEPPLTAEAEAMNVSGHPEKGPLRNGQVWRMVGGLGALCIPQVAVVTFAAVFMNDVGHLGTAAISACIVAVQLGAAVARVWSGRFTDRHGNRRSFLKNCALLTAALYGVLSLLVAIATSIPEVGGILMLTAMGVLIAGGVAASSWHGIAFTELATIAGSGHTGTVLGLGNTFAFGAYFLAPLAIPHVLELSSWSGVWLMTAFFALLAIALFPKMAVVNRG